MGKPTLVIFTGDHHVGSDDAIAPESLTRTKVSRGLLEKWTKQFLPHLKRQAHNHRFVLALGGDHVEGRHHGIERVWGDAKEQRDAAIALLLPLANMADEIMAVPGTEAHVGSGGENDRQIAQELGARIISQRVLLRVSNRLLDWTHHGIAVSPNGWMADNGIATAIRRVEDAALRNYQPMPDCIISHHAHRSPAPLFMRGMWGAVCGAWQASTPHGHKIAARSCVDIGVLAWWPEPNRLERWLYNDEASATR